MNIVIAGYGKMGHEVEIQAKKLNIPVRAIADSYGGLAKLSGVEGSLAIDFSYPETILKNIEVYALRRMSAVIGTTGWLDGLDEAKRLVEKSGIALLYGSNFSMGMNIFWKLVERSAAFMDKFSDYDVMVHETHHRNKKDAPSGTAIVLAKILRDGIKRKKEEGVNISSSRVGSAMGKHEVIFDSAIDTIELIHVAKDRSAYALGALACAAWIENKKGFFTIEDYIDERLQNG